MEPVSLAVGLGIGLVFGGLALLCLAVAYDTGVRTFTAFRDPVPVDALDEGLVKVRGTVRSADRTLSGAVVDEGVLMSEVVCARAEGLTGKLDDYEDHQRLTAVAARKPTAFAVGGSAYAPCNNPPNTARLTPQRSQSY